MGCGVDIVAFGGLLTLVGDIGEIVGERWVCVGSWVNCFGPRGNKEKEVGNENLPVREEVDLCMGQQSLSFPSRDACLLCQPHPIYARGRNARMELRPGAPRDEPYSVTGWCWTLLPAVVISPDERKRVR